MFDFEKEEQATTEEVSPDWENAEWESITDAHATEEENSGRADARQSPEAATARIYRKINAKRRERTAIDAIRYALIAIGLGILAYFMAKYDINWLAWTLGIAGGISGLISAYGAGMYHEM